MLCVYCGRRSRLQAGTCRIWPSKTMIVVVGSTVLVHQTLKNITNRTTSPRNTPLLLFMDMWTCRSKDQRIKGSTAAAGGGLKRPMAAEGGLKRKRQKSRSFVVDGRRIKMIGSIASKIYFQRIKNSRRNPVSIHV